MTVFVKECKKILDLRILLILGVFTFMYYFVYMEISAYPAGGQETMSSYDIPFAAELVKEKGPFLSIRDGSFIEDKIRRMTEEYNEIIAADQQLRAVGITTLDEMRKWRGRQMEKEETELGQEERDVMKRCDELTFDDPVTSKLGFEIQYAERIRDSRGIQYGVPQEEADALIREIYDDPDTTELYKTAMRQRCTKQEVSLLPSGLLYIVQEDMRYLAVLLILCFLALMVPYQIRERLRGVTGLYAATRTGRKIFGKQFVAGTASCGLVGLLQLIVYLSVCAGKGMLVFWRCPAWAADSNDYWLDGISFGSYIVLYMLLIWMFAMAGLVAAYWIGRKASGYIPAISISIPVGGILCAVALTLFNRLFRIFPTDRIALWQLFVLGVWILAAGIFLFIRLRRDKRRDLLV